MPEPTTTQPCANCDEPIRELAEDDDVYDRRDFTYVHVWWSGDGRTMTGSPRCDLDLYATPKRSEETP